MGGGVERGVQMLLTTVGAFGVFSLMTVGTDYWLYSRGVCRSKDGGDNDTVHKNEEVMTHSGLWRTCCLEAFIFGSDQIPVKGMKCLKIMISSCELTENDYPEAATCFDILYLPKYTSPESLRTKLVTAIKSKNKNAWETQRVRQHLWNEATQQKRLQLLMEQTLATTPYLMIYTCTYIKDEEQLGRNCP